MTFKHWTPAEIAILREMAAEPGVMKHKIGRLPGRPYGSIKEKARSLGLNKTTVSELAMDILADGLPHTSREIAAKIGRLEKSVAGFLIRASADGPNQSVHVSDAKGPHSARRYVIGAGANVGRADKVVIRRIKPSIESIEDSKHRARAAWWPSADPVVLASMNAMVHAGRAQA